MYKLITRLHVLECENCGETVIVDDNQLIELIYAGEVSLTEDEDFDECEMCGMC